MAYGVWSTHLFAGRITSAATAAATGYTVPAGKVVVVRSADAFVDAAGGLLVGRLITAGWMHFLSTQDVPTYHCVHWDGREVLNAGEHLGCEWLGGAHRITCSGYVLNAVP